MSEPKEAVNAEPPAMGAEVAGDATPDGPDRPIRSGAGSGEQSRPATPEPAAIFRPPFPRVSDGWVAVYAEPSSLHGPLVGELALDLIDSRSRESALRAKVAELEARIAALTAVLDRASRHEMEDNRCAACDADASVPHDATCFVGGALGGAHAAAAGAAQAVYVEERGKREAAEAALARANEALGNIHRKAYDALPGVRAHRDALQEIMRMASAAGWDNAAAGAQGSAAQKPEPRDAG